MGNVKKWLVAVVCVVMVFALAACSMVTVNEQKDMAQVVANVNGVEILKSQYKTMLLNLLYNYGMTQESLDSNENKKELLESALDEAVNQELLYQKAEEEGLADNSEENKAEIKAQLQSSMDTMKELYYNNAATNGNTEAEAQAQYEEYVKSMGYDDLDYAVAQSIRQKAVNALYEQIMEEVNYTEEQAREYYDMQVDAQKAIIDEDASKFQLYQTFGEAYYNPAGSKYVKNLLIGIPEEKKNEIAALRTEGNDTDANVMRDEELAKIKADADAALARVTAGEDFDALIEELGTDSGMTTEPGKTYGYLVYDGATYAQEFKDAALALQKVGDMTGLVPSDFGYHIIQYVKDGAGAVDFDMIKDDLMATQQSAAQNSHYLEYIEQLKEGASIKTYPNRLELHS